jgi:hypothetical protein
VHLSHDLTAMQPDRNLADADFSRDLLIDATGHKQCHDLSLACGQRFVTHPKTGDLLFALQPRAIAAEPRLYRIEKILVMQRFGQEFDGPGLHCPY